MSMYVHGINDMKEVSKYLSEKLHYLDGRAVALAMRMYLLEKKAANARYGDDDFDNSELDEFFYFHSSAVRLLNDFEMLKRLDSIIYQAGESDELYKAISEVVKPVIADILNSSEMLRNHPNYQEDMLYEEANTW